MAAVAMSAPIPGATPMSGATAAVARMEDNEATDGLRRSEQGPLVDEGHAAVERMAEAYAQDLLRDQGSGLATASIASDCSIAQAPMHPHTQAAPART